MLLGIILYGCNFPVKIMYVSFGDACQVQAHEVFQLRT